MVLEETEDPVELPTGSSRERVALGVKSVSASGGKVNNPARGASRHRKRTGIRRNGLGKSLFLTSKALESP